MGRSTELPHHIRDARQDDAPALAACVIEPITAVFRGRVPQQCLNWLTVEESTANWRKWFRRRQEGRDDRFLLVAETTDGRVAGCALGGPQTEEPPFAGELYMLGVLPAYQGQGIGKALTGAVARRLAAAGIDSMCVRVLRANPNAAFYEHLGAQFVREENYNWNGVTLPQAVYGWRDTAGLTSFPETP